MNMRFYGLTGAFLRPHRNLSFPLHFSTCENVFKFQGILYLAYLLLIQKRVK